jgi:hypothetical protein
VGVGSVDQLLLQVGVLVCELADADGLGAHLGGLGSIVRLRLGKCGGEGGLSVS